MKSKILILCTGNSCRSQMAHGLFSKLRPSEFECLSAGIETHGLNPIAVEVMKEIDIDISNFTSNNVSEYQSESFDGVITVCDHAEKNCPVFSKNILRIHKYFKDPPKLAENLEDPEEVLKVYRMVRDEIKLFVQEFSLAN